MATVKIKVTGYLYLEESEGGDPKDPTGFTTEGYDKWVTEGGAMLASLEDFESEVVA